MCPALGKWDGMCGCGEGIGRMDCRGVVRGLGGWTTEVW